MLLGRKAGERKESLFSHRRIRKRGTGEKMYCAPDSAELGCLDVTVKRKNLSCFLITKRERKRQESLLTEKVVRLPVSLK
jgi:hypothetical protein